MKKWTQRHKHTPSPPAWRNYVEEQLRAGFGVEDIAIMVDYHADVIRRYVRGLRDAGVLDQWWPKKSGAAE